MKTLSRRAGSMVLFGVAFSILSASAASTNTWVGNTDANWGTSGNWAFSSGSGPVASGDTLIFGAAGSSGLSLNNDLSGLTVNKLTFNSGAGSFTFGGKNITLGTGGIDASAMTSGTQTFAFTNVIGTGLQRWNVGTGATLSFGYLGAGADAADLFTPNGAIAIISKTGTIKTTTADGWGWRSGAVAGTGLLGPGMVIDNGNNTYDWASVGNQTPGTSRAIVVPTYTTAANSDAHNVKVTANTTVTPNASWASLLVQGATLTHNGANIYLDTGIILENGGVINGSGPIKANADGLYIYVPDSGTISSSIQNNGATVKLLYKSGPGTLTLSGANTYTGNTVVYEGALIQSTAATGAGGYVVKNGATLGVTVVSGGSLKMSSLSFGNSTCTFTGLVANSTAITNSGALTLAGTVTVNVSGSVPVGTYPLIGSGSISGTGGFAVGTMPAGLAASITTNGNTIVLNLNVDSSFPTCGGVATPNPVNLREYVLLTVTVTNGGSPTISSVVVNASAIGGSSSLNLVSAGNQIYTNSVKATSVANFGIPVQLPVTVTDGNNHSSSANISLTVNPPISSTDTWIGNTDANWSTSGNWTFSYGSGPVTNGDSVVFGTAGTSGTLLNNNISNLSLNNLTFNSGADAFTIGGNAFTLTGNLTNNAANNETLNGVAIGAGVVTTIKNLGSGTLALGALSESGGGTVRFSATGPISTSTTDFGMLGGWAVIDNGNKTYDWAHSGSSGVNNIVAATYDAPVAADAGNVKCTSNVSLVNNAHTWASILVSGANLNFGAWNLYLASGGLILQNGGIYTGAGALLCNNGSFFVHVPDSGTINASLQNNGATAAALYKDGPGTLTLSGASTYTGSTVIYEGALIQSTAATGAGSYVVKDGATLGVSVVGGTLNMASLAFGNSTTNTFTGIGTSSAAINNNGALTLTGTVTVNVGGTILPVGQYPLIASASISGTGGFVVGSLPTGTVASIVTNGNTIVLNVSTSQPPVFVWTGQNNSSWDFSTANNWLSNGVATVYSDGWNVRFDDSAVRGNVNIAANVAPLSLVVSNSTRSYTFTGSAIAGATGLIKSGNGLLVLANTNTYSGNTTISNGTLQLGDGAGNNGLIVGNILNNGRLVFANPSNQTFSGVITGSGTLVKSAANQLTFSGANNFTGSLTLSNGTLVVTKAQSLGTNIAVRDAATLSVMPSANATYLSPTTLTVGSSGGATLQFGVVGTNNPILMPGTLTLNGTTTIKIAWAPYLKNVNFPLFTGYTGGTLVLGSEPKGSHGKLVVNAGTVSYVVTNFDFVHPSALHTQADFDRMKAKVQAGAHPWIDSYNILINNWPAQSNAVSHAQTTLIRGGAGENYQFAYFDTAEAYQLALRWKITGDANYANTAIGILNSWANINTSLAGDPNIELLEIYGYQFACAAEILRSYPGWAPADVAKFQAWMSDQWYGLAHGFLSAHFGACSTHQWANWDECTMASMMAIGILCDDTNIYNEALTYFKQGMGNGNIEQAIYYIHPGYMGQGQEMGRDQGHAGLNVALLGVICQMAYNQGDDLFAYQNNRVLAMCEYFAKFNIGQDVPYLPYKACDFDLQTNLGGSSRGDNRPCWDLIYNHYVNIKGLAAPWSTLYAARNRPDGGGSNYGGDSGGYDQLGFTTLTCSLDPIAIGRNPSCLTAALNGPQQVQLNWWGTAYATNYYVKRATTSGGPYTTIATNMANAMPYTDLGSSQALTTNLLTYTDSDVTNGVSYYYTVSALTPLGESGNGNEAVVSVQPQLIAFYKFNESSGTSSADASGNGKTATLNGATWTTGHSNNAVNLNGSSQYVSLPGNVITNVTGDFTIASWVYLNGAQGYWARLFDFGVEQSAVWGSTYYTTPTRYMFLAPSAGVITFAITLGTSGGEQRIYGNQSMPVNGWQHVAVTVSGNTGTLYLNGVAIGTGTITIPPSQLGSLNSNFIGKSQWSPDPYLNGKVDDFRIYNGALSAAQISALAANYPVQPSAPTNVIATGVSANQINLTWSPATGAPNYYVKRSTVNGGPYTTVSVPLAQTNYSDTGLVGSTTYYYVVTAVNDGGATNSVQVSARTVSTTPVTLSLNSSGGQLQFNWPADHTGWRLQMNTDLAGTNWLDVVGANATNVLTIPATNGNAFYRLVYP